MTEAEEVTRVLEGDAEKSQKLTRSQSLRLSFGVGVLTCECGGKRRLIAVITQAKVIKKILKHLGLPSEVVLKEAQPVWRLRGPPGELFPEDVDETGHDLAVDDDFGVDFPDELPVNDVAAQARGWNAVRGGALAGWRISFEIHGKLALTRGYRGRRVAG
ncbi:MAG: hypothetical protein HY902_12920 [Deltaproteobacteria bacterium]|nr:hypothetical protein [Deltaproteobacteria bacterium]